MSRGRFIYFPQHILIFNVKNSWSYIQARVFSMRKSMIFDSGRVSWFFCLEFFRWGPVCLDEFFRPDVGLRTSRDPLGTNLDEKTRPERVRWQDHRVLSSRLAPKGHRTPGGQKLPKHKKKTKRKQQQKNEMQTSPRKPDLRRLEKAVYSTVTE